MKKVNLSRVIVTLFDSYSEIISEVFINRKIFIALSLEKIVNRDECFINLVRQNVGYVDGVGVLLALWKKGVCHKRRLPGFILWQEIIKSNPEAGYYLIGGSKEVIEDVIVKLKSDFRDINIKGYTDGYSYYERVTEVKMELLESKPRVVFVAMGSPRQERVMMDLFKSYNASYLGLGGSYDYYIGKVRPTPLWIQRIGLQWLHRAILEPKRFGRLMKILKSLFKRFLKIQR